MPTYIYTPEDVFNMIVKDNISTKFKVSLVAVAGLPGSGKSTLVEKLAPYRRNSREIELQTADMPELRLREVGYCSTTRQESLTPTWGQYTWDDIYMYTLARALLAKRNAMPQLKEWAHVERFPKELLENKGLLDHFKNLYNKMQKGLANVGIDKESDFRFHLMSEPSYVLLNMWDIGVSKSLNESLPLIARLMNPFVLLNVLNLYRDGLKKLRQSPEKSKAHKDQHVMKSRSRGHYLCRVCGLCKNKGQSILIATHSNKVERDVGRVARLTEAGIRAKAGDVGVKGLRELLAVNLNDEKDCDCIKRSIVELMESTDAFDVHLPLTWIFLHSAILHHKSEKSDFRMSRSDFVELSSHCGIRSTEDVEKCLKFFTRIGSIMYSKEFFGDEIIYHPRNFFKKLENLYSSVEAADKHRKESTSQGILCKKVAEDIWGEDSEFFWRLMQKAGVATLTKVLPRPNNPEGHYKYNMHCPFPECRETELLFVSTLRIERLPRKENIGEDSLFITFNTEYIPADIQTVLVKYLKIAIPRLELKLTKCYNSTEFELPEDGHFKVIVHGDVVQLAVTGYDNHDKDREFKSIIKNTCIKVLEKVLVYFPGFQYQFGLLCKECLKLSSTDPAPNNNIISYLTFLPSQYETKLYCRDYFHRRLVQDENGEEVERHKCNKMIELSSAQLRWMTLTGREAQQTSTTGSACYEARIVSYSELVQIVRLIPLENYATICTRLSPPQSRHYQASPTPTEERVVAALTEWQRQSPSNRREKMARILLRMPGCYRAAIKLDPKVYNASTEEVPPHPSHNTVSPVEIEILSNCAIQWKDLAAGLGLAEDRVKEIEQSPCTSNRERRRKVLQTFSAESGTRDRVTEVLDKMKWKAAANSLRCGYINRYSTHSLL